MMRDEKNSFKFIIVLFLICAIPYLFWPHFELTVEIFDTPLMLILVSVFIILDFIILHKLLFLVRLRIVKEIAKTKEISVHQRDQIKKILVTNNDVFWLTKKAFIFYALIFFGITFAIFLLDCIVIYKGLFGYHEFDEGEAHIIGKIVSLPALTLFAGINFIISSHNLKSEDPAKEYLTFIFSGIPSYFYHWVGMALYRLLLET